MIRRPGVCPQKPQSVLPLRTIRAVLEMVIRSMSTSKNEAFTLGRMKCSTPRSHQLLLDHHRDDPQSWYWVPIDGLSFNPRYEDLRLAGAAYWRQHGSHGKSSPLLRARSRARKRRSQIVKQPRQNSTNQSKTRIFRSLPPTTFLTRSGKRLLSREYRIVGTRLSDRTTPYPLFPRGFSQQPTANSR